MMSASLPRRFLLGFILGALACSAPARAMEIGTQYYDKTAQTPSRLVVSLSGEIKDGDTDQILAELQRYDLNTLDEVYFALDSGGGSLREGLILGTTIGQLPIRSVYTTVVNDPSSQRPATCASSCVFVYLGGTYRLLDDDARIGVHKFYSSGGDLDGQEAMSGAQSMSGAITSFLHARGVDPDFYSDIVSAEGDDIYWVPHQRLRDMHVITGTLDDESVEYTNVDGKVSLRIEQNAAVGHNVIRLMCDEKGIYGIAFLMEPENANPSDFYLVNRDIPYEPEYASIASRDNNTSMVIFRPGAVAASAIFKTSSISAVLMNGPQMYYGFQGEVRDPKIADMIANCPAQNYDAATAGNDYPAPGQGFAAAPDPGNAPASGGNPWAVPDARQSPEPRVVQTPPPASSGHSFVRGPDVDIEGGDLTRNGWRNITLEQCESQCSAMQSCAGVSYVVAKQWCWPKEPSGRVVTRPGVISSVKQ